MNLKIISTSIGRKVVVYRRIFRVLGKQRQSAYQILNSFLLFAFYVATDRQICTKNILLVDEYTLPKINLLKHF